MPERDKLTAQEAWQALLEMEDQDALDEILAMSDDEVYAALEKEGFEGGEVRAMGKKWRAELEAIAAGSAKVVPLRRDAPPRAGTKPAEKVVALRPGRSRYLLLALAAAFAVGVGVPAGVYVTRVLFPPAPTPPAPSLRASSAEKAAPPGPDIADLRQEGLDACAARKWQQCLDWFDKARAIDPNAPEPEIIALQRRRALAALEGDAGIDDYAKEVPSGAVPQPKPKGQTK